MNRDTSIFSVMLALLVAALAFFVSGQPGPAMRSERGWVIRPRSPGDGAPAFSLPDVTGRMVSLSDYRGKVIVVNFWAISCVPCRQELPDFIALQSRYGGKGLQVIGIGLDKLDELKEFAEKSGLNYEVLCSTNEVAWLFGGISGVPRTFVIDRRGSIVSIYAGPTPGKLLEEEVLRLLD